MIIIEGRRWFQRTYGNTYHSVSVYDGPELKGRIPFHYGYERAFLQTAAEILGIPYSELCDQMREHPENFHVSVVDVPRRRDL